MESFSAKVRKIDINPYVQVPDDVLRRLQQVAQKERGPIPVRGTLQGKPFSTTVVRFRGMWRLYLNTPMRQAAHVDVGDEVTVRVEFDRAPRTVEAPRAFTDALSKKQTGKRSV